MKRFFSYLFLAAGIALIPFMSGCLHQAPVSRLASHTIHATSDELHIELTGTVDQHEYRSFTQSIQYMKANGMKVMHLHLFTPGGYVVAMMAILDILQDAKNSGIEIITYANGVCMSAGVPIFLMGDTRIIRPNAQLMVHPMGGLPDEENVNAETWAVFKAWKQVYIDILVNITTLTGEEANAMLTGSSADDLTWFNAYKALELEFATIVR